MLTSEGFWSVLWAIIDEANGSKEKLKALLASEPRAVIVAFHKAFCRAISNLDEIKCGESASEDYRNDVFTLIVSKGREYYDAIVKHPERIPDDIDPDGPFFGNVAGNVLWERFGEEIYDLHDH
jgi:hypothetical protein